MIARWVFTEDYHLVNIVLPFIFRTASHYLHSLIQLQSPAIAGLCS